MSTFAALSNENDPKLILLGVVSVASGKFWSLGLDLRKVRDYEFVAFFHCDGTMRNTTLAEFAMGLVSHRSGALTELLQRPAPTSSPYNTDDKAVVIENHITTFNDLTDV